MTDRKWSGVVSGRFSDSSPNNANVPRKRFMLLYTTGTDGWRMADIFERLDQAREARTWVPKGARTRIYTIAAVEER